MVKRHVVLVGLPGSGKTTIGRLVAAELRAPFVDLDEAIERGGKSIARVFAEDGEAAFRKLERAEMEAALARSGSVIAAGGGWAAQPGNLEGLTGRALTLYLEVTPEFAGGRLERAGHRTSDIGHRPLLAGGDVVERLRELLLARRGFYQRCDMTVRADRDDPGEVAREVAQLARSLAGWY